MSAFRNGYEDLRGRYVGALLTVGSGTDSRLTGFGPAQTKVAVRQPTASQTSKQVVDERESCRGKYLYPEDDRAAEIYSDCLSGS